MKGLLLVLLLCLLGCSSQIPSPSPPSPPAQQPASASTASSPKTSIFDRRDEWFYIDSVPAGVKVSEVREGKDDTSLGVTPLKLNLPLGKTKRIFLRVDYDWYLKQIAQCPGLHEWASHVELDYYPSNPLPGTFAFPAKEHRLIQEWPNNGFAAVGPIIEIGNDDTENRICLVFLPFQEGLSSLFPIMPPQGTYRDIDADQWRKKLVEEYQATQEQVDEVVSSLSRCGAAVYFARDPDEELMWREVFITIQHPPLSGPIGTVWTEKRY